MSVPSYPFHSILLKLPNKGMSFSFPPLKLTNKEIEEYSKIILFILFRSILFPPPKRGLGNFIYKHKYNKCLIIITRSTKISYLDKNLERETYFLKGKIIISFELFRVWYKLLTNYFIFQSNILSSHIIVN